MESDTFLEDLCCPQCGGGFARDGALRAAAVGHGLRCAACDRVYSGDARHVDFLWEPGPEIISELKGMEEERRAGLVVTREGGMLYEELRRANYEGLRAVFEKARNGVTVEIGPGPVSWLYPLMGTEARKYYCVDIQQPDASMRASNLMYLRSDMNRIPLRDGAVDVAVASGAVHHSRDMDRAVAEMARVLKPGGTAVLFNDPVSGLLKGRDGHVIDRHAGVHEVAYPVKRYVAAVRRAGLAPELGFPAYVLDRISRNALEGIKFGGLGRLLRPVVLHPVIRGLIVRHPSPAYALFGVPLILVGRK